MIGAVQDRLALVRSLLTESMVRLNPDTTNTSAESQAWSALADAYQLVSTAEAFLEAGPAVTPGDEPSPHRHLRAVK